MTGKILKKKTGHTTYKHGLPFGECVARCINEQLDRIAKDFPSLVIIDGGQGQGKTTLMLHIIDYINKLNGKPEAELSKKHHPQLSLGGREFVRNFATCKKEGLPVIGYDEAGDFSRRGAIGRFNAMINRRFETFRSSNIMVILCLPTFMILDNHLFDLQVPRVLLHLEGREETVTYGNFKSYSLYGMNWVRYWNERLPKAIRSQAYKKVTPNFHGHFLDLPTERRNKLKILSDEGKDKESLKAEIKEEGLMPYTEIASRTNRSVGYIRKIILHLKIKPARKVNRINYYRQEIINRIEDYMDGLTDEKPLSVVGK